MTVNLFSPAKTAALIAVFILCISAIKTVDGQQIKFTRTYGNGQYNYGMRVIQCNDGGYLLLGNESSIQGNTDIHLIRTDSLGVLTGETVIGDEGVYWANDFRRTSDGGLIICGLIQKTDSSGYNALLIKTDVTGAVSWIKDFGGYDWDVAYSVTETAAGTFILAGETYSYGHGNCDMYLVHAGQNGDLLWSKTYGGAMADGANCIEAFSDGSFMAGGYTGSSGMGSLDGYLIRFDINGDTLWTRTHGEEGEDIIYSLKETADSGFVFVGSTESYGAIQHEIWLMQFRKNLDYVWKLPEFWNIGGGDDYALSVALNDSAQFIITGHTDGAGHGRREISILVMGEYNNFRYSNTTGSVWDEEGNHAIQTSDSGYIIIGSSDGIGAAETNIILVKTDRECRLDTANIHYFPTGKPELVNPAILLPTVSSGSFFLYTPEAGKTCLTIFSIDGIQLFKTQLNMMAGTQQPVSLHGLAPGIYLCDIKQNGKTTRIKIVKT